MQPTCDNSAKVRQLVACWSHTSLSSGLMALAAISWRGLYTEYRESHRFAVVITAAQGRRRSPNRLIKWSPRESSRAAGVCSVMRAEESETCYRDHGSRSPPPVAVGFKWRSAVFRSRPPRI